MKNLTLFNVETRFKDRFYCCLESLKGNKFLLVFLMVMGSFFTQGISAQGTLVPSCNLVGPLEACAVLNANDTSGDFIINIEVARSGAPNYGTNPLTGNTVDHTFNNNFSYTFVSNTAGAFIRSYGVVTYNAATNKTTQALVVCPGTNTPEFNLQLNVTNTSSSPNTFCECSKSVSVSKVAVTSSFSPIACFGQTSTLTAVGSFSDINQYTYTLLPSGPSNSNGVFAGLPGSEAGITYVINCTSAEGCEAITSQTITQPAYNPVVLTCPQDSIASSCLTQDQVNTAFNAWLNSFSATGGTNRVVTRSPLNPSAPSACGGTITVTWTGTESCPGAPVTCSSTFTVPAPPAVVNNAPANSTTNACAYADQGAATAAFNAWLAQFTTTGGCSPVGTYGQPQAPAYCGGSTTVTYNVSDRCYQGASFTRTFTITPAPAVVANGPANSTTNACTYANQDAANAAFNTWLAGFTVSGGCSPVGTYGQPVAPAYCGGTTTVTYNVTDKCYQGTQIVRSFTITPAAAVVANGPASSTTSACSYADQDAANAAFNAWLAGFTVSGGCAPVGTYGAPQAPAYCGGTTTVTYNVTDKCYQGTQIVRSFTITPAPQVTVLTSGNSETSTCSYADQAAATAAFNAWIAGFSVSGGCAPIGSFGEGVRQAPNYCGGSTTVTYTVTDKCYQTTSYERTFVIIPAPAVIANGPASTQTSACIYADQAAATAAFNAWLTGFTVSGGCAPVGTYGQPQAPAYCGGTTTVTYNVTDKCYAGTQIVRSFTITPAPQVIVNGPVSSETNACVYADQDAANAAFNAWLTGFTVSGGCAPVGVYGEPVAPAYCGGTTSVTYRVTDKCYQGASITRVFVITPAPQVTVLTSENSTTNACRYADQDAANAAFTAWLGGFSVSGGCAPLGSFGEGTPQAPAYCGGSTTVTYTVTDKCYQTTPFTRTFTITPAPAVIANGPENATSNACAYADQDAATAAFNAWLTGFTVSGGCAPVGTYGEPQAPAYCGGTTTVTYNVTDKCYQGTQIVRTFTITPAPAVNVLTSASSQTSTCAYADQAAATAAFNAWIAGFSVSGGCAPLGSFGEGTPQAPNYCGGSTTVTYTVTDKCYQTTSYERTFLITPAPGVVANGPASLETNACSYADQAAATAAFNAWLTGFTVSGGCAPVGTYGQPQAPAYCGGTTTVTYNVTDKCYAGTQIVRTFTIIAPPAISVNGPANATSPACSYADQAAATAAFNAWLLNFTVTGGCAPVGSYGQPSAPAYCGGTTTVTYNVTDKCYEGSQIVRTFTITPAPAVVISSPANSTTSASAYVDQAAADAAFAAWLSQFSVSGGCAPSGSYGQPSAPLYCGGTITVTYTVTDKCYQTTTVDRTFTITPVAPPVIGAPTNSTTNACIYADQAAAQAAFNAWLAQFTVSGGINPLGSFGEGTPQAPAYCGGTTTVTYTVTDRCYEPIVTTRTFTITPPPAVTVNGPDNSTSNACSYADQDAANAAFTAWLAGFTVGGGCSPVGVLAIVGASPTAPINAPLYCGGSVTVSYTVTDKCYQGSTIFGTFTITPPAAVNVTTQENNTTNTCVYADQAAATAAFNAWLAGFSVSGGCAPVGSFGEGTPQAPAYCGGSTTVTYTVSDKCYQQTQYTATFTITAPAAVIVNGPDSATSAACSYADQASATAAFNAWLAGFTVSGGCAPSGSYGQPSAPAYCGGSTTVTYTVTDKCYQGATIERTFTITPAPAVAVNGPENSTASACAYADQAAVTSAFNAWLSGFTVSGGCAPVGTYGQPQAPALCGGTTTVTYNVTDKCYEGTQIVRTFTITAPAPVVVTSAQNSTTTSCTYANQDEATAAFNTWLQGFTVSGGCAPIGSFGEGTPQAPALCGGSTTVTYTVTDKCYQTSTATATFTITAPAPVVINSDTVTYNSCAFANQQALNDAFNAWLAEFTVSGGCAPTATVQGQPQAPALCGGTTCVTFLVTDRCYTGTVTIKFTVTPPPAVVVNGPDNATSNACSYADQAAATAAFNAWLAGFTATGGCSPVGSYGEPQAPAYCGGTTTVIYNVTDRCYEGAPITRTFTITPAPAVVVNGSDNATSNACTYADQAAADAAFTAWLNGFTVTGGCAPIGSFGEGTPQAPAYCGGTTTVVYTASDKCYQGTPITRTFTITPAPAVVVNGPENSTSNACSYANQAAADAAYNAWLNGFSVSGGCAPVGGFSSEQTAPAYCGGTRTVTYVVADKCYQGTPVTRTFTITPAPAVVFNCGQNVTVPACSTQTQINTAWAAFLASTTASGGCNNGTITNNAPAQAPSKCGGSVDVTWTYNITTCGETQSCTRTFTVLAPAPVVINCGQNVTVPACSTQAQVNAAWTAFLNSTTASGGCGGVLTRSSCSAPSICGGSVDVTWTYTVGSCGQTQSCTRTFTVAAPAPVVISCGENVTLPACSTQAQLNAAWTAFLNSTTATGGCGGVLTRTSCSAPSLCGGYVDVTWKYTVATCGTQSGCGSSNYVTCTRRFTVAAPAQVAMHCGNNVTVPACSTQAQVDAAWATFLASTTASGGCGGVLTNNGGSAPSICGGYKDVTWTYTVGSCGTQSGCGSTNTVTCTKRFTVAAPSQVVFNCGTNVTVPACSTQAQINTAWNAFLNSTTASGGCGGVLTRSQVSAPPACGGYVDVTWTYTVASCGTQSGCAANNQLTCTKRFTVAASTPVVFNCGTDVTVPACSTQAQVNTAWNAFLASTTASGGCNGVFSRTSPSTPSSCGGSVAVTWTYASTACGGQTSTQSCTKTFTVAAPAPVVLTPGNNVTLPACSTQAQLNAAWTAFLNSTTASGGCNGVLTRTSCGAPSLCGGYVDVTWTYTVATCGQASGCGSSNTTTQSQSISRRFTVATPDPITFSAGNNVTLPACSTQAQLNAAWTAFLNSTTVTGGCGTTLTRTSCSAPALCGGYVDVTWTAATTSCGQQSGCGSSNYQSITRRFTVLAPSQVTFTCGNNVTVSGTSTQAQITAAWNTFLNSTNANGGCNGMLTRTSPAMPTTCGQYADVTWTYTVGSCGTQSGCGSSNQMTCTKRFTIGGGSTNVTINVNNVTVPSCKTQAQVNALWASFLASATVSGGSGTLTNNGASKTIPSACGGYADVTWTYSGGGCGQTVVTCGGQTTTVSGNYTVTRRFTVTSGGEVNVSGPSNVTYVNTNFNSQYALNNAFACWLAQFTTVSSGCGSTAVFSGDCRVAPSWTNGGTVRVTYSITGNCNSDSVCATFTVTKNGGNCKAEVPAEVKNAMAVKAYPNPFSETFSLDLTTSSQAKVAVAIYDMTGKLIEQREVSAEEVSGLQVGDRFPTGVYNVIVTQGAEVKTLRVIKR